MALTGVTNAHEPHPSQQHAGLRHAVLRPQQDVTIPKASIYYQFNVEYETSSVDLSAPSISCGPRFESQAHHQCFLHALLHL